MATKTMVSYVSYGFLEETARALRLVSRVCRLSIAISGSAEKTEKCVSPGLGDRLGKSRLGFCSLVWVDPEKLTGGLQVGQKKPVLLSYR